MLTGYSSDNLLNYLSGLLSFPTRPAVYLALFTTAPGDNDSGAVEVSGGSYARVQIGGSDTLSAATSSGTTLTFASVPSWIQPGMTVRDATTPAAISAGTTVVSTTSTTVTLSQAVASATGASDVITFASIDAASGAGPTSNSNNSTITFPQATASWGTVVAFGLYDAVSGGDLLAWDWLGNDPWFPFQCTSASPGVVTAYGITAGSTPNLANGASVVFTARFGGTLPSGFSSQTTETVAGLSNDTFNVSVNTTTTGGGMVRQVVSQSIPSGVTASFAVGSLILFAA
jgi:uncharacterized RDD family membrane protein YckC